MTQLVVAQTDTVVPESDLEDLRYLRTGYISGDRQSDKLLAVFTSSLPGDGRLPLRWHYRSHEQFLKRYGNLGTIVWAAAANSHLLLINGWRVLRIWHDTTKCCYVDLADNIAASLPQQLHTRVETVPLANAKKSNPFTKRIKCWQQWQMLALVETVKRTYGLDHSRLSLFRS